MIILNSKKKFDLLSKTIKNVWKTYRKDNYNIIT